MCFLTKKNQPYLTSRLGEWHSKFSDPSVEGHVTRVWQEADGAEAAILDLEEEVDFKSISISHGFEGQQSYRLR